MKKLFTLSLLFVGMFLTFNGLAQEQNYGNMISQNDDGTYFYMRSSLEMVYIESENFPNKNLVDKSWNTYMDPRKNFPSQYNKHGADIGTVNIGNIKDVSNKDVASRITNYINNNRVANKLVMKWFNYNRNGSVNYDINYPENPDAKINMQTIFDRGYYTVNSGEENLDNTALKRDRDVRIKELSMKLLPFTFMTFTKFEFYPNEPVARAVRDAAISVAKLAYNRNLKNGMNPKMAELKYNLTVLAANGVYNATKDGYTLKSDTWLYKMVWNDEIERYFNDEVLKNPSLLETSNKFRMQYVDHQDNKSTVIISATRSFEQIINLTMVRNLNKVFIELQNRNEVFRVWTPILDFHTLVSPNLEAPITVDGKIITAKIGTKEGLRGGEMFSVCDEDGNFYGYAEVVKGKVWDNDEGFGEDAACNYVPQVDKKGKPVTCTTLKGKKLKNARTGLILMNPKQAKKPRVAAKIGTKEGVEDGEKFTVYQYDAKANKLRRAGTMRVVKGKVWDNTYVNNNDMTLQSNEQRSKKALKKRDKEGLRTTETLFKGSVKVQPGMFLRQTR